MVIQSLFTHEFLEKPEECDIMADMPSGSRKIIALEVEQALSARLYNALVPEESKPKAASTQIVLPTMLDQGIADKVEWKLPTWQHVKWTLHSLAPIFTIGLDSIASISNAVKIYCLWLKNPSARPSGVSDKNLAEFISFILLDLSELFVPRKLPDNKTAALASGRKHVELCQYVLNTINHDLIDSCELFKEPASESWNLLTRLALGVCDNLLWRDNQNYLADELTDLLLNSCFLLFLRSEIFCEKLWKKFSSCYKLWCHRLKSILAWGSIVLSLTHHSRSILLDADQNAPISFGLQSVQYSVSCKPEFALYAWARIAYFIPKLPSLSADIFLRSLQALEKVINVWINSPPSQIPFASQQKCIPDANTVFEVYGEFIFDAAAYDKPTHEAGRAIALSLICQVITKRQYRCNIEEKYLHSSYSCLDMALRGDIHPVASTLAHIEEVLASRLPGVRCLIMSTFLAVRRIVPRLAAQKNSSIPLPPDQLRMNCYRLLSCISSLFQEDFSLSNLDQESPSSLDHLYSSSIFQCYNISLNGLKASTTSSSTLKAVVLDTLVAALLVEENQLNVRIILNIVSFRAFCDTNSFPGLVPLLVKILEETLSTEKWSTETQILVLRIIERFAQFGPFELDIHRRLCMSLMNFAVNVHSKSTLALNIRTLLSVYDAVFCWLSSLPRIDSDCVSVVITTLVRFMNDPFARNPSNSSNAHPSPSKAKSRKSQATSTDSSVGLGKRLRLPLGERYFTRESEALPAADSSSPTFLKGVDHLFKEYTESTIQKLLTLLFQQFINSNYPLMVDDFGNEDDISSDVSEFKFYALSDSSILAFHKDIVIYRNPAGKRIWRLIRDFFPQTKSVPEPDTCRLESSEEVLDLTSGFDVQAFRSPLVTCRDDPNESRDSEPILNDSQWSFGLECNAEVMKEIKSNIKEAQSLVNTSKSQLPTKCRNIPMRNPAVPSNSDFDRLLFANLGFLVPEMRNFLAPISIKDMSELNRLDSMPTRDLIQIPIFYAHMVKDLNEKISESFKAFIQGLGFFVDSNTKNAFSATSQWQSTGPFFADSSVEVNFNVHYSVSPEALAVNEQFQTVSVIWSEDVEDIHNLPLRLNLQTSSFVLLVVCPLPLGQGNQKGHFFRIRILLSRMAPAATAVDVFMHTSHMFGPLTDGMIVARQDLSKLVRDTVVSAHLFVHHFIQNQPNPLMLRAARLKSLIFRNYKPNSFGDMLNSFLY